MVKSSRIDDSYCPGSRGNINSWKPCLYKGLPYMTSILILKDTETYLKLVVKYIVYILSHYIWSKCFVVRMTQQILKQASFFSTKHIDQKQYPSYWERAFRNDLNALRNIKKTWPAYAGCFFLSQREIMHAHKSGEFLLLISASYRKSVDPINTITSTLTQSFSV